MIRDLLDRDRITELDFGRGDDAYKSLWAGRRRQRIGVVLANLRAAGRPVGVGPAQARTVRAEPSSKGRGSAVRRRATGPGSPWSPFVEPRNRR